MNREKYPNYFLAACILYAVIFLVTLSYFILPSLGFGFGYAEFFPITILMFLPMLLLVVYNFTPHIQFLWGKEKIIRTAAIAVIIVDFLIAMLLMILLI
ncbi:MAG TPA: hypothetical protein VJI12_01640 [archaeon]|nr:hypothetical protein [archaeon]